MNEKKVNWDKFSGLVDTLEANIKRSGHSYDSILVLNRGSMVVAGILGYRLGIRKIEYVDIDCIYKDNYKTVVDVKVNSSLNVGNLMGRILFITDVAHSGNTIEQGMNLLKEKYPDNIVDFGTLYYMNTSKIIPKYYAEKIEAEWIVFPWDKEGYTPKSNHI